MKVRLVLAGGVGLLAAAGASALLWRGAESAPTADISFRGEPVSHDQLALGRKLYAANCATCHGVNLEGQPDWKRRLDNGRMPAPPHDKSGHTWHHSDQDLFTITKRGVGAVVTGYQSDMPGFADVLSDAEIAAVLAYIKSTWPERERDFQAKVTANHKGGR